MDLQNDVQVAVPFTIPAQNNLSAYTDQLFYSAADYTALTADQLNADQLARYNSWVAVMTAPVPVQTPQNQTQVDLQAQIDAAQQTITQLQDQLTQIQAATNITV